MNTHPKIISAFCILLAAAPAMADVNRKASSLAKLSAEQIVEKNVAARGGLKAWKAVQSMTMTGKIDAGRMRAPPSAPLTNLKKARFDINKIPTEAKVIQLPFVMELKRPNKMRFELQFRGDTAIQAFDGSNGWKLRPFLGRHEVEPFTPDEIKSASQQQDLDGFLINHTAKGTKVESEGMEQVEGHDAYKLKLTLKDGQIRHTWVDAQTFLDIKIDGSRRMDGKIKPVATYLRDYKSVQGLMVPFTLETSVEGVKDTEKIIIEQVSLNPALADTQFIRPE